MDLTKLHLHWRPSTYKGKTYKSYSLARPFREDGKNRKEIVLKLGKLSQADIDRWRMFLGALKKPNIFIASLDDIDTLRHHKYLDLAIINQIWQEWKLDNPFANNKKTSVDLCKIARILTINRCVDPISKSRLIDWYPKTWLPWMLGINQEHMNASRIYRSLDAIEDCKEQICSHLYNMVKQRSPDSLDSIFYDLSSATFSGSKCLLMKWGHCKEGFQNHVVLALVVNKDGLPIYWEVLQGNTADSNTIEWLIQGLNKKFQSQSSTLVFDRGMVSGDNLARLEDKNYKYISAMDKNQIENIADNIDFTGFKHLSPDIIDQQAENLDGFAKLNHITYYREVKLEGKRRYILCFNPQLFKDQRKARDAAIQNFKDYVGKLNLELLQAKNSRGEKPTQEKFDKQIARLKLKNIVDVSLNEIQIKSTDKDGNQKIVTTYQGAVDPINNMVLADHGKLDGFWLLVTNHNEKTGDRFILSATDAINPYRDKTIIESAFRDIKSFVVIKPIWVWTEKHVKAHFTICVLAYLCNRIISMGLHENKGELTSDIISHERALEELSDCTVDMIQVKNTGISGYKRSYIDHEKMELLDRLNLSKILKDKTIKIANKKFE